MNLIVENLTGIVNGIKFIVEFITFAAHEVASTITTCMTIASNIGAFFQWLPFTVRGIFLTCLTIIVLYKIVGREG